MRRSFILIVIALFVATPVTPAMAQILDFTATQPRNVSEFEAAQTLAIFNTAPGFSSARIFGQFSGADDSVVDHGIKLRRVAGRKRFARRGPITPYFHGSAGYTRIDFVSPIRGTQGTQQYREDDTVISAIAGLGGRYDLGSGFSLGAEFSIGVTHIRSVGVIEQNGATVQRLRSEDINSVLIGTAVEAGYETQVFDATVSITPRFEYYHARSFNTERASLQGRGEFQVVSATAELRDFGTLSIGGYAFEPRLFGRAVYLPGQLDEAIGFDYYLQSGVVVHVPIDQMMQRNFGWGDWLPPLKLTASGLIGDDVRGFGLGIGVALN